MKNIANFLFEVGMLKRTPRTGFQFLGSGAESVAEHSFRTAMIGYTLAQMDGKVDVSRVLQMCLFHDIPEARIGDLNYVNKKYVNVDENKAIDDLAVQLPFGDDYRATLHEFNVRETREAQLAHDADQLEMVLSLKERKDLGNLALNVTAGTKIMSLAAYEVFRERGLPIFYVHPQKDLLIPLLPAGPALAPAPPARPSGSGR